MGGRGRGRGRGGSSMSVNIEALGFSRGEALPSASVHPPPMFPVLEHHPLPLEQNEKYNYLIDLKRYFQTSMEDSPYYVKRADEKKDITRYTDKYKLSNSTSAETSMILYSRVPEELWPQKKAKRTKKSKSTLKSVQKAIQQLEQKEGEGSKVESGDEGAAGSDADKSGDEDEKEVGDEELELDEEEMEEENDYIQEYFDNGEDFGDVDDGDDDGPVY